MNVHQEPVLEPLGIGIARIAVSQIDPKVIEVAYYGCAQDGGSQEAVRQREYRSDTAIQLPGEFSLKDAGLDVSVTRSSDYSFKISVFRNDVLFAQGLGLTDPDDPVAIMVAWWTGDIEPYGVVKYSIRDPQTIVGYYISKMTPGEPGEDIAIGDTGGGFQGDYVLNSQEVNGRTWGPHVWSLSRRGAVTDLAWEENGRVFCRGIGMPDPRDSSSIIGTYIAL